MARPLASPPSTPTVAVCVQGQGTYWLEIERGALERLRRHPRLNSSWIEKFDMATEWRWLAGLIVRTGDPALGRALRRRQLAAINVSNYQPCGLPRAGPDDWAVGRLAAETFASLGLRQVLFIGDDSLGSQLRGRGFVAAARQRGLQVQCRHGLPTTDELRQLVVNAGGQRCGVFACNDDLAVAVLQRCLAASIAVPAQVALLGTGNADRAQVHSPRPLSSIVLPAYGIGVAAAEMLLDWLAHPHRRPADRLLPPLRVIHRQTTGKPAVADPIVKAALVLISQQAETPLSVNSVIGQVAVGSRRSLERRFRRSLGQGISQVARQMRLAKAKALLLRPGLSIKEVAYRTGFSSPQKFANVFRAHEGCSPRAFRQRAGLASRPGPR